MPPKATPPTASLTRMSERGSADRADLDALREFTEGIIPGRNAEVRPSTAKEEAATMGLALAIEADNWLLKSRDGLPGDPGEPVDVWCGVIPLALTAGKPEAAPWSVGPVPASVANFVAAHPAP